MLCLMVFIAMEKNSQQIEGADFEKGEVLNIDLGMTLLKKRWDFSKDPKEVRIRIMLISGKGFPGRKESKHKVPEKPAWHVWEIGKMTGWMEWSD